MSVQGVLSERVRMTTVACGRNHMVCLDQNGHAWAIGDGRAGCGVSLDGAGKLPRPALITSLSQLSLKKVECGTDHTIAMASNGDVFTWGRALGESSGSGSSDWLLPDANRGLAGGEAVDIGAGDAHVAVVSITGDTYMWGHNHHGQCARDPSDHSHSSFFSPVRAGGALTNVVARRVACGKYHTAVLSAEGAVFTFGAGMCGQLGRDSWQLGDNSAPHWQPDRVVFPSGDLIPPTYIVQVVCGHEHTLCLTDSGQAFSFGCGSHGQLAQGGVKNFRLPVPVRMLGKLCEISAGADWSLLRERLGKVFQAGRDEHDVDDSRLLRQVHP